MTIVTRIDAMPETETLSPVERQTYRNGMAKLAAAVNIITSFGPDGWCGFTASAVSSVTDAPPTLMVCINRTTQSYEPIKAAGVLCVNTVGAGHEDLVGKFSGGVKTMAARFEGTDWTTGVTGAPILPDAPVAFDCRIVQSVSVGTHDVLFCEVVDIHESDDASSLVYARRAFHHV